MAETQRSGPWLEFRIEQIEGQGVEAAKLAELLGDFSSALYAIARAKLGKVAARPGRRSADEEALAAIRIVRILPGSAVIEADPPALELQMRMDPVPWPTADAVLMDFANEAKRSTSSEPSAFARPEIRKHVQAVLRDCSRIGRQSEIVVRPRASSGLVTEDGEFRVRLPTAGPPPEEAEPEPTAPPRHRRLTGHVYMVDVEPGRSRIRLKQPDGHDVTLETDSALADVLKRAVDSAVELEALEELAGDQVTSRRAINLSLLPSAGAGSDKPPKTVAELAEEQGLVGLHPDYRSLASEVWDTREHLAEFEEYLRQTRQPTQG